MRRHFIGLLVGILAAGVLSAAGGKTWQYGQWSDMQSFTSSGGDTIHYYLFAPTGAGASEPLPLVLWLHGGLKSNGTGGPNVVQDAFYKDEHQKAHRCFVLRPVAIQGRNWVSPRGSGLGSHPMPEEPSASMRAVIELLDTVVKGQRVDPKRLYVVGASMGGYGTWDLIQRQPERFAAAMPICGGGDPSKAARLKDMAIWISHGDRDPYVPVQGSREMFDALVKARGVEPVVKDEPARIVRASPDGRLRYIEYKGGNHNAAWDKGLTEPDVVDWFFRQSLPASAGRPGAKP